MTMREMNEKTYVPVLPLRAREGALSMSRDVPKSESMARGLL